MVLSDGDSRGLVTSPNYPHNYPINVSCHYYIDGLVDKQNLEKVKLLFDDFDLPTVRDRSSSVHITTTTAITTAAINVIVIEQ